MRESPVRRRVGAASRYARLAPEVRAKLDGDSKRRTVARLALERLDPVRSLPSDALREHGFDRVDMHNALLLLVDLGLAVPSPVRGEGWLLGPRAPR
jgi:hypothetical protein